MRIQCPENLRVPPEGSSAEGESGPKVRPKGVANGQRVNIPVPYIIDTEGRRRLDQLDVGYRFKRSKALKNGENILS